MIPKPIYRRGRKGEPAFVLIETPRRKPKSQSRWYYDKNDRQPKARPTGAAKRPLPKRAYDRDGLSRLGAPTAIGYREGAEWGRTTPYLKLQFSHYALQAINLEYEQHLGQAFTLNIGDDIAAKMLASGNPKRFLSRRISTELRKALGRTVELWFVFELSRGNAGSKPYHHIHGEILLRRGEREKARAALRKAGGDWGRTKGVPHFQVKYEADLSDDGWVSYAVKDDRLNSVPMLKRIAGSSNAPIWMQDGLDSAFFITEKLKRLAGLFYESVRPHVRLTPNSMKAMNEAIAKAEAKAVANRKTGMPTPASLPAPPN